MPVARPDCVHRPRTLYERNPVGFSQGVAALLACALPLSLLLRQWLRLVRQMEMSALLALDVADRAIGSHTVRPLAAARP
jgi:hypothetical protein